MAGSRKRVLKDLKRDGAEIGIDVEDCECLTDWVVKARGAPFGHRKVAHESWQGWASAVASAECECGVRVRSASADHSKRCGFTPARGAAATPTYNSIHHY